MSLLDVLVKELQEWPTDAEYLGQAADGTLHVNGFGGDTPFTRHTDECYTQPDDGRDYFGGIVTRAEWERAKEIAA